MAEWSGVLDQQSGLLFEGVRFRVQGFRSRVSGFGFEIDCFGFRFGGLGLCVLGFGFGPSGFVSWVSRFGIRALCPMFLAWGFRSFMFRVSPQPETPRHELVSCNKLVRCGGGNPPQKALGGGIPCSFLEPFARSWSHFEGICRQKFTKSSKNDFWLRYRRALRGTQVPTRTSTQRMPPAGPTSALSPGSQILYTLNPQP